MTRQALVTYSCDGPDCTTTTVMADAMFGPEDWYALEPPEVAEWDMEGSLHFCALPCLMSWVVNQLGPVSP